MKARVLTIRCCVIPSPFVPASLLFLSAFPFSVWSFLAVYFSLSCLLSESQEIWGLLIRFVRGLSCRSLTFPALSFSLIPQTLLLLTLLLLSDFSFFFIFPFSFWSWSFNSWTSFPNILMKLLHALFQVCLSFFPEEWMNRKRTSLLCALFHDSTFFFF